MKRRLLQIVVLLILGAIVNVAVAWGCAFAEPSLSVANIEWTSHERWKAISVTRQFGRESILRIDRWSDYNENRTMYEANPWWHVWHERLGDRVGPRVWAYGLPTYSMSAACKWRQHPWMFNNDFVTIGGWERRGGGVIPWSPLWPGFAINTIFYAAILWVMFFAPGRLRRALRRRRGRCPACAYPIGTSEVCTECGAALMTHA